MYSDHISIMYPHYDCMPTDNAIYIKNWLISYWLMIPVGLMCWAVVPMMGAEIDEECSHKDM